jgi:hypothetical protein
MMPLIDEMIETVRAQAAELGKTAAAELLKRPKLAAKIDGVATGIISQFADIMKQSGLANEDIALLCQTLRQAYQAELPAGEGTRH